MLATGMAIALIRLSIGVQPIEIHDEAQWIMRDPAIAWCCGPRECSVVPGGGIQVETGGWFVPTTGQHFKLGDAYTYWSKDDRMWWCRADGATGTPMQGKVQCLFVPKLKF